MSLYRGIQSAIFFYLSCAPCSEAAYKKRRRQQANIDRIARSELIMEQPDLYVHPSPFATNTHWGDEIVMGPGPPPQRVDKKTARCRGITTASTSDTATSQEPRSPSTEQPPPLSLPSSPALSSLDGSWNSRRYQRSDSPTRSPHPLPSPRIGYFDSKRPHVNTHHPPTTSAVSAHKTDTRWLLAPTSRVKIMEGALQPPGRSRASTRSTQRTLDTVPSRPTSRPRLLDGTASPPRAPSPVAAPALKRAAPPPSPLVLRSAAASNARPAPAAAPNDIELSLLKPSPPPPSHDDSIPPRPALQRATTAPKRPDSSLELLQRTVSPRALLKSPFVKSPVVEARVRLPPVDEEERRQLAEVRMRLHLLWEDGESGRRDSGVDELARGEGVRWRWSMDI